VSVLLEWRKPNVERTKTNRVAKFTQPWNSSAHNCKSSFRKCLFEYESSRVHTYAHGHRRDFFLREASRGFFQNFFQGGQKWWNLFFTLRNWKNNLYLLIISKSRGRPRPHAPPFRRPCIWRWKVHKLSF